MKELLEIYYKGFAQKSGWEQTLADDFEFVMNDGEPLIGKQAYIAMCEKFSQTYRTMRVVRSIVEGNDACTIASYDWILPDGKTKTGNVIEFWKAENGFLKELKIYFNPQKL
ncbi:nuclear transport factor 2 family protein [Capnocytophaga sp.]|uniref:nuclear transport factor 2 family protein n=1 Tax=Capnocytophaga sp. TaxID=44737 RepID=UPI0026DB7613|nr:nuclear transport factor 2 family protein [Capnocytophaga sp.]MDO5106253.1 nuclear transport factor 2 family protein [Capnocytophaga sp.]